MAASVGERSGKGVRVQPLPIEVPEHEPFWNDILERKAFGEALSASLGAIEGPGVFAIDGQWGTGKTTFLRMFTQLLRNQKHRVIEINAWETDFAEDPLAALSSSLAALAPDESRREKLKSAAVNLLRVAGPVATVHGGPCQLRFGCAAGGGKCAREMGGNRPRSFRGAQAITEGLQGCAGKPGRGM